MYLYIIYNVILDNSLLIASFLTSANPVQRRKEGNSVPAKATRTGNDNFVEGLRLAVFCVEQ